MVGTVRESASEEGQFGREGVGMAWWVEMLWFREVGAVGMVRSGLGSEGGWEDFGEGHAAAVGLASGSVLGAMGECFGLPD